MIFYPMPRAAKHDLDFEGVTAARNSAASIVSHGGKTAMLATIISDSLRPEEVEVRLRAVSHLEELGVDRQTIYI